MGNLFKMKLLRFIGYFSQLSALIGPRGASVFAVAFLYRKTFPPREGELATISVGPYTFHFPSVVYFEGLFTEIFFKETYYLARTDKPIRVIDCGANIGVSLLYIKIRAPGARVMCFEPNPAARAVLGKNIAENNWGNDVQVFPYALGKKKGSVEFFVENKVATSSGGSVTKHLEKRGRNLDSSMVEVDILSHYIEGPIDFLKIDIEGGEFDVLEELIAHNTLRYVAQVQLEYHYIPEFFTRTLNEMLTLLETNGFHTFVRSAAMPHQIVGHDTMHTYMIFAWR